MQYEPPQQLPEPRLHTGPGTCSSVLVTAHVAVQTRTDWRVACREQQVPKPSWRLDGVQERGCSSGLHNDARAAYVGLSGSVCIAEPLRGATTAGSTCSESMIAASRYADCERWQLGCRGREHERDEVERLGGLLYCFPFLRAFVALRTAWLRVGSHHFVLAEAQGCYDATSWGRQQFGATWTRIADLCRVPWRPGVVGMTL